MEPVKTWFPASDVSVTLDMKSTELANTVPVCSTVCLFVCLCIFVFLFVSLAVCSHNHVNCFFYQDLLSQFHCS